MNQYPNFTLNNDFTNGGTVAIEQAFDDFLPDDIARAIYEDLQRRFAIGLYDAIQRCKSPVIVDTFEERGQISALSYPLEGYPFSVPRGSIPKKTVIRLSANLKPVERNMVLVDPYKSLKEWVIYDYGEDHSYFYIKAHRMLDKILKFFGVT